MRCKHVRERILESILAGESRLPEGITPHLEKCPACQLEARLLRRGVEALQFIPVVEPPADLKARTMDRIRKDAYKESLWTLLSDSLRARTPAFAAAALLVVMAAVGVVLAVNNYAPHPTEPRVEVVKHSQHMLVQDIEWLQAQDWVSKSERYAKALDEAKQAIEEMANAGSNADEVRFIARRIRETGLVNELDWVAEAAPPSDRHVVVRLRLEIEEMARPLPGEQ